MKMGSNAEYMLNLETLAARFLTPSQDSERAISSNGQPKKKSLKTLDGLAPPASMLAANWLDLVTPTRSQGQEEFIQCPGFCSLGPKRDCSHTFSPISSGL